MAWSDLKTDVLELLGTARDLGENVWNKGGSVVHDSASLAKGAGGGLNATAEVAVRTPVRMLNSFLTPLAKNPTLVIIGLVVAVGMGIKNRFSKQAAGSSPEEQMQKLTVAKAHMQEENDALQERLERRGAEQPGFHASRTVSSRQPAGASHTR